MELPSVQINNFRINTPGSILFVYNYIFQKRRVTTNLHNLYSSSIFVVDGSPVEDMYSFFINDESHFLDINKVFEGSTVNNPALMRYVSSYLTYSSYRSSFPLRSVDEGYRHIRVCRVFTNLVKMALSANCSVYELEKLHQSESLFNYYLTNSGLKAHQAYELYDFFSHGYHRYMYELIELYLKSRLFTDRFKTEIGSVMSGSFQVSVRPTDLSDRTVNLFLVLLLTRLGSDGCEFGLFFEMTKSVRRSFYSSALHFKMVSCIDSGLFKKVDIDRSVYRYFIFPKLPQTVIKRFGLNIPELKNLEKNELLVLDSKTDEKVKVTI